MSITCLKGGNQIYFAIILGSYLVLRKWFVRKPIRGRNIVHFIFNKIIITIVFFSSDLWTKIPSQYSVSMHKPNHLDVYSVLIHKPNHLAVYSVLIHKPNHLDVYSVLIHKDLVGSSLISQLKAWTLTCLHKVHHMFNMCKTYHVIIICKSHVNVLRIMCKSHVIEYAIIIWFLTHVNQRLD